MAIDQNPPPLKSVADVTPAIDNEIVTYRAISPGAVFSLLLGLVSLFCFADLWFLIVAGGAIGVGLLSIRKIRRYPEVLTGVNMARLGITLGLIFGLSSLTRSYVAEFLIGREAGQFATKFVEVLQRGTLPQALFYMQPPDYRKGKTPDSIFEEIKKTGQPNRPDPIMERTEAIQNIKLRLKGPGETIRFAKIEQQLEFKLSVSANALIELDGPGSKEFPEKEQFALFVMLKPEGSSGRGDWFVEKVIFPYTPSTAGILVPAKATDEHGH